MTRPEAHWRKAEFISSPDAGVLKQGRQRHIGRVVSIVPLLKEVPLSGRMNFFPPNKARLWAQGKLYFWASISYLAQDHADHTKARPPRYGTLPFFLPPTSGLPTKLRLYTPLQMLSLGLVVHKIGDEPLRASCGNYPSNDMGGGLPDLSWVHLPDTPIFYIGQHILLLISHVLPPSCDLLDYHWVGMYYHHKTRIPPCPCHTPLLL